MNVFKQIAFGKKLTSATTVIEKVERVDAGLPIGMRGLDGLSDRGRKAVSDEVAILIDYTRKIPRHLITEAILQNMRVSANLGRTQRAKAQSRLLNMMIEAGAALPIEDFERSYA